MHDTAKRAAAVIVLFILVVSEYCIMIYITFIFHGTLQVAVRKLINFQLHGYIRRKNMPLSRDSERKH